MERPRRRHRQQRRDRLVLLNIYIGPISPAYHEASPPKKKLCCSLPIRPQSRLIGLRSNGYVLLGVCLLLVGLVTAAAHIEFDVEVKLSDVL
jgi:hypothetical protein